MEYTHTRFPITKEQYKELRKRRIIPAWTKELHINKLWRYTKQNVIQLNHDQISFIARVFDSCGYRVVDWVVVRY